MFIKRTYSALFRPWKLNWKLKTIQLKDPRYKAIKSLIEGKSLGGLKDIFTILPYSVVKQDLKINYNTLRGRIINGNLLTMKNIIDLAILFDVDTEEIFRLSLNDIVKLPKTTTRKK